MKETTPRLAALDNALALRREGYEFISSRCRRFHSDVVRGRLLGRDVLFITGREAARVFYDEKRFQRAGVLPAPAFRTMFGEGAIHGLDDEPHRRRKAMFLAMMTKTSIARFIAIFQDEWNAAAERWQGAERIVLIDEAQMVLCRSACLWVGVPTGQDETARLANDCALMLNGFGAVGPRLWRARSARMRAERWGRDVIARLRRGELRPDADAPVRIVADHRESHRELLPARLAAVELVNLVRPITALGRFIAFQVLALHDYPAYRESLRKDDQLLDPFVHEVRRFYPFVPFLGARARKKFEWLGASFAPGQLVLLDVYGTLHDPRVWDAPDTFLPERFLRREPTPFDLIPQGGGDFSGGHRCAGEWLTIETLKQVLRLMTRHFEYEVPAQDLGYDLSRPLAIPRSGVVLRRLRRNEVAPVVVDARAVRGVDGGAARSA